MTKDLGDRMFFSQPSKKRLSQHFATASDNEGKALKDSPKARKEGRGKAVESPPGSHTFH